MTKKDLFDALHQCKDEYIDEVMAEDFNSTFTDEDARHIKNHHQSGRKLAAAAVIFVVTLGLGVSVMATASDTFRLWVIQMFGGHNVSEVDLGNNSPHGDGDMDDAKSTPDESKQFTFKDDTQVIGERESFISEYHYEGDEEIVDRVYTIRGNDLEELQISSFQGDYDGQPFSFEYAVINQEIYGFNYKGDIGGVFYYADGDVVYAELCHVIEEESTVEKGCIAALNLNTGAVSKLSGDNMICNFVMSPNGKMILCNHRSAGYWSVFDIEAQSEEKVDGINGYNRTSEIEFVDDYHILTLGEPFMRGDIEWYSTYLIDLRTREIIDEFKDNGEITMRWSYTLSGNSLKIYDITNGDSFTIEGVEDAVHVVRTQGELALFGDLEEEDTAFYLVNLDTQSFMEIKLPEELFFDVEMHLVAKEKKILLTNEGEGYLVDISELY